MLWLREMRWWVILGALVAIALSAAALSVALSAAAGVRATSLELSQRLVPAAAASVSLQSQYTNQQSLLREYINAGGSGSVAPYRTATAGVVAEEATLAGLLHGYPVVEKALAATEAAYANWLKIVATPSLADAARGDFAAALQLQNNIYLIRPPSLALSTQRLAMQADITAAEQTATARLVSAQGTNFRALLAMCIVVGLIALGGVAAVWRRLLRPFGQLRRATDAVASGRYDTHIPAVGPAELADLGRSAELMRTRLVSALTEREHAEERFRRLFDTAPDALIAIGSDGSIAMANARAAGLFGYPPSELIGLAGDALLSEDDDGGRLAFFDSSQERPAEDTMQLTGRRRNGSEFPAEVTMSTLPVGAGMQVTWAIRDMTERLALEEERERLRREAEQERVARRKRQSERLESLGQLVGGVAHDFNNLLNVIQGYTDFTAEQVAAFAEKDERLRTTLEDIEQVRSAAQKAARLTRQLLTFARHDVVRPEVIDLNEAVSSAGELLHRTLGEHIELLITTDPDLWRVKADRGQLEQVLVNLAINARDAMPGGGRLTIDTRNIDVDAHIAEERPGLKPGRYVRMRVADTGTGMDRATMERVFEPFFTTKPKGHGTGLGLATVYGIVTGAGGSVDIYSEVGLGTTFSVMLPATDADAAAEGKPRPPAGASGQGESVLLVEDEDSLREMTRRMLAGNGYLVVVAHNAEHAVQLGEDPRLKIDLLLTDLVMPGMLGNEVAARITAIHPDVPVLFMSGYAEPILNAQGLAAEGMDLVEKPFTAATLLARVRKALAGAQVPRPRGAASVVEPPVVEPPIGPAGV